MNDGTINFTYHKAHPVPGIESNVEPGPSDILFAETKYGRIGGAICFDFNYPALILQAGRKNIDIMLQASDHSFSSHIFSLLGLGDH